MKIILIGQAPTNQHQEVPYSTTLLYEWLKECGISIEQAQEMFEFEAVYNKFPGLNENGKGHKKPTQEQMLEHYHETLCHKLLKVKKVIILGNVAKNFLESTPFWEGRTIQKLYLIHPSRLNYNLYMKNKDIIISQLKNFLT